MTRRLGTITVSAANTDLTGATRTGMVQLCIGPCQITGLAANATATSTAGSIQFFIDGDSSAPNLVHQMAVSAVTVAAGTPAWRWADDTVRFALNAGDRLMVTTYVAESFRVHAFGEPG